MDLSGADLDNVTRTILGEAGPTATPASMAAVASVIRNRLVSGTYGKTPTEIVHAPNQFEAWNPPSGTGPALTADPKSPAYRQAAALAQGVFSGVVQDQTGGATHFFAPVAQASLGRAPPAWASGQPLAEIGGHQFYAPGGGATPRQISGPPTTSTPGLAPGGPETVTPYSGPGSLPTPGIPAAMPFPNIRGLSPADAFLAGMQHSQQQGGFGGGGGLGALAFGKQGLMGLFPQQIQQNGLLGSAINAIGGGLKGALAAGPPQQPPLAMAQPQPTQGLLSQLFGGGASLGA